MCATVLHPLLPVPPSICSGERLTLVINPQWQPQGQVISGGRQMGSGILNAMAVQRAQNHCRSDCPAFATTQPRALIAPPCCADFGFGRARKAAERFVAAFDEVYYLRCAWGRNGRTRHLGVSTAVHQGQVAAVHAALPEPGPRAPN